MSSSEWTDPWAIHCPSNTPPPQLNFDKEMVVGVFHGEGVNCTAIRPLHILDRQNTTELFVAGHYFQSNRKFIPASAYGIFVVPKSAKRLPVKENIQGYIGAPPVWKQVAEFDPLPK